MRPAAVEESGSGRDLRGDVAEDPREHVAAVEPLDGVEETRGSVEDLVAVNPAVDLRHGVQSGYYFIDKSGFFRFWVLAF